MAAASLHRHLRLRLMLPPRVALPSSRFQMARSRHLDPVASLFHRFQTDKSRLLAHLEDQPHPHHLADPLHHLAAPFVLQLMPPALVARTALLAVIHLRQQEKPPSALAARTAPSQRLELLQLPAEPVPTRLLSESAPALTVRRNPLPAPLSQALKAPKNTPVVQAHSPSASPG